MGEMEESRTVVDRPLPITPAPTSKPGTSIAKPTVATSTSIAISEQTLDAVEAQRMRGMMTGLAVSSAVTALIVFAIGGDDLAKQIHAAALGGSALVSAALALLFRKPGRYYPRVAVN
ncbi:MAG: hypothetical protein H0T42_15770, partial [Deltaproteobacteria bacterium]|nr:hypothetical protein [Deltaproteobacteria bacterium]